MSLNAICKAACLGATAMYLLDPERGRYRRSLLRDKFASLTTCMTDGLDVVTRDFGNRLQGLSSEMRSLRNLNEPVTDDVLSARIRSKLGRYTSHPRAIEVDVVDGRVTLSGPVLAKEAEPLLDVVRGLAGVNHVENKLEVHQSAENVPALQGGRPRAGEPIDLFQESWSPTTKFLLGLAGAGFWMTGSIRGASFITGLGACGLAMAANGMFSGTESDGNQESGRQHKQGSMRGDERIAKEGRSMEFGRTGRSEGFNTMQQPSMAANPTETGLRGDV